MKAKAPVDEPKNELPDDDVLIFLMENFTLVTRGNATIAQRAQRPTHGECDCGCAPQQITRLAPLEV